MLNKAEDKSEILSAIKGMTAEDASSEQLFDLVFDFFVASSDKNEARQKDMCEDVLTQLITYVEIDVRRRISEKIASMERAPRRVVQFLSVEPIQVSRPVLAQSPLLDDEDLLNVTRLCGPQHLEAISERGEISVVVTNELMRLGTAKVWERLANNNGAMLADKSLAFLTNRARENKTIQYGLIDRPDLPSSVIARIVEEAGESIREHLARSGRNDLLAHLDIAKATAKKRVLSTSSVLGFEYDTAYQEVLRHEKMRKLTSRDLLEAASKDQFPRVCCIFARLADLKLEEAVHWLSRREIDPAIVAFKALSLDREVVDALLKTGPWKRILTNPTRMRALRALDDLKPDVAKRIFAARSGSFSPQKGVA